MPSVAAELARTSVKHEFRAKRVGTSKSNQLAWLRARTREVIKL